MMKLKLVAAVLALAGIVSLLMGSTYLSTSVAVVCTAVALPLSLHLAFRWFIGIMEYSSDSLLWLSSVVLTAISMLMAIDILQDIGAVSVPLNAAIDHIQKIREVGQYVSIANIVSILLAVAVPSPPKHNNDED